jgi:hypothetical protein
MTELFVNQDGTAIKDIVIISVEIQKLGLRQR